MGDISKDWPTYFPPAQKKKKNFVPLCGFSADVTIKLEESEDLVEEVEDISLDFASKEWGQKLCWFSFQLILVTPCTSISVMFLSRLMSSCC
jgi:hypothetical protein